MRKFNNYGNAMASVAPVAFAPASTTESMFGVSLMHFLCDNRKYCINSSFAPSANLAYSIGKIQPVGNDTYAVEVFITGTLTYLPHRPVPCGCNPCGEVCPVQEPVYAKAIVNVYSTAVPTPTVAGSGVAVVNPANVVDCCTVTNAVQILSEFTVTVVAATTTEG